MKRVAVGVIGGDGDAKKVFYAGLRVFPADKAVVVTTPDHEWVADEVAADLGKLGVPVEKRLLESVSFESFFKAVSEIKRDADGASMVLNVDTDYRSSCIALSAAFINGVQAIGLMDEKIIAYPIMKFSYYTALSERKLSLLKTIAEVGKIGSLEELSKKTGLSLPLVLYHVHGTREKPGLEQLGLVESRREKGRLCVYPTTLGSLIEQGYVQVAQPPQRLKKRAKNQ